MTNPFNKSKPSSDKPKFEGKKGVWKTLASIWNGEHGFFAKDDTYGGTLLFLAKDENGQVKGLYKVKKIQFNDREAMEKRRKGGKLPENLIANLSMNLEADANELVDLANLKSLEELFESSESNK